MHYKTVKKSHVVNAHHTKMIQNTCESSRSRSDEHGGAGHSTQTSKRSGGSKEFHESQFHLDKRLGEGHFGKIYRARMAIKPFNPFCSRDDEDVAADGDAIYALKCFSKSLLMKANQKKGSRLMELLTREIEVHSRLDHPCIVNYYGHIFGSTHLALVLECAQHGDLFTFMQQKVPTSIEKLFVARHVLRQISSAVDYLRSISVAHRDIKPENILVIDVVGSPPKFKICDFGWAVKYDRSIRQKTLCGTAEYVPPELLGEQGDASISYDAQYVDLWALGVLCFELLHGISPFYVETGEEDNATKTTLLIYRKIRSFKGVAFLPMDCVSIECFDLMDSLMQREPSKRRSVTAHPFLHPRYFSI
mmetsp:Transcript_20338/g.44030  ORF Transcript_20338/g.44030 Transcript_20338/m.44030 type:complete len:362 (+) Transcript_20338:73-1158(+)